MMVSCSTFAALDYAAQDWLRDELWVHGLELVDNGNAWVVRPPRSATEAA